MKFSKATNKEYIWTQARNIYGKLEILLANKY